MGNCAGDSGDLPPEERQKGREIEKFLRQEHSAAPTNILVLGAGESGKSTFIKQVRALFAREFSLDERRAYIAVIRQNLVNAFKRIALVLKRQGSTLLPENAPLLDAFLGLNPIVNEIDDELLGMMKSWWTDPAVQQVVSQWSRYQIQETISYFMNQLDRVADKDYEPDNNDIFHARNRTTGILELNFTFNKLNIRIVDVGGQRSERKKWIHCFQNVACVLFFVALSEYDERLFEDETVNRMVESLELFEEVASQHWFASTPICLMFNKTDLFKAKINTVSLGTCFADWTGGLTTDYRIAADFVINKFLALLPKKSAQYSREVQAYETCALQTESVRFVFNAIAGTIITQNLRGSGL